MFAALKSVVHPRAQHGPSSQHVARTAQATEAPLRDAISHVRNEVRRDVPLLPARAARVAAQATSEPTCSNGMACAGIDWIVGPSRQSSEVAPVSALLGDEAGGAIEWIARPARLRGPLVVPIRANGSDVPEALRRQLADTCGVEVVPLLLDAHEIGYRLQSGPVPSKTVYVSCHGTGVGQGTFPKPPGIEFRFAAPRNHLLASKTVGYADMLRKSEVSFDDDSQVYGQDVRLAVDYALSGGIAASAEAVARYMAWHRRVGTPIEFDFALINRYAGVVCFSDLVQALQAAPEAAPERLICHFCRPQDDTPGLFNALERKQHRAGVQ